MAELSSTIIIVPTKDQNHNPSDFPAYIDANGVLHLLICFETSESRQGVKLFVTAMRKA